MGCKKQLKKTEKRLLQYNCASQFHSYIRSCVLNLLENAWFPCTLMCSKFDFTTQIACFVFFLLLQRKVGFGISGMGLEWKEVGFGIWEKNPRAWANEGRSSAASTSTILSCFRAKSIKKKNWLSQFLLLILSSLTLYFMALWLYDSMTIWLFDFITPWLYDSMVYD